MGLAQVIENVKLVGFWNSSGKIFKIFGQKRERKLGIKHRGDLLDPYDFLA